MPIALLQFPTDLIGDILTLCYPFELFILSDCSKKTRKLVKSKVTNKWKIQSIDSTSIDLKSGYIKKEYRFTIVEYPEFHYQQRTLMIGIGIYLMYPNEAVDELLKDVVEVFGCKSIRSIKSEDFEEDSEKFLDLCQAIIDLDLQVEHMDLNSYWYYDCRDFEELRDQMEKSKKINIVRP
ncbi:hypothetical protein B9Z55_003675 [Caenorhabditis nigoni]|uniref:F-box domain-containing protein n=1 Tax=Caenorhabditis nigoni TaxID=1611254 RepID=A0A2G5VRJ5_9PELO|nr:hypothetical protein B9Z55_003675 [Caenorhabditis nigoni]